MAQRDTLGTHLRVFQELSYREFFILNRPEKAKMCPNCVNPMFSYS